MIKKEKHIFILRFYYSMRLICFYLLGFGVFILTSCNKETENVEEETAEIITIKISSLADIVKSRAESVPVSGNPAVLNDGLLIFSESNGTIRNIMQVAPGVTGGDVIGISDFISPQGVTVDDISSKCTQIDFFGNLYSDVVPPSIGTNISSFRESVRNITALSDDSGEVDNVGLYSHTTIDRSLIPRTADLIVSAISSRIEIGKFERDADYFETFDIEGIFINNFYYRATLTGIVNNNDLIYYPSVSAFEENGEPYYTSLYKGITFDWDKTTYVAQQDATDYFPFTPGNVWAYNIYSGEVPHIVVKFTNVKASAAYENYLGQDPFLKHTYWYLTITQLINKSTTQTLTHLEQGCVYSLENIKITLGVLEPIPEPEGDEVLADVQVSIVPWIPVDASTTLPNLPW